MRALFFLLDGETNASSYRRALQYFPLLREHGIEPTASLPTPEPVYQRLVERRRPTTRARLAFYGLFLASRLVDVLRAGHFDVVVVQRDLFPFGPPYLERLLRRVARSVVFDTDDAVYLRPSFTPDTVFQRLRHFEKVEEVVRHAAWVTAATEPIAAWARQRTDRVSVVPMALDPAPYDRARRRRPRQKTGSPVVLGWTGTAGSIQYLEGLAPALSQLAARRPILVRVVSGAGRDVRLPGVPLDVRPWARETYLDDLATFDVGLVPLRDEPFERQKFPFKMLEYMALGVPIVGSALGTVADVVQSGENGLLVAAPQEWEAQIAALIDSPERRRALGAAGQATLVERFTVERVGPLLADVLKRAGGPDGPPELRSRRRPVG